MFDSILREFKYATWLWSDDNSPLMQHVLAGNTDGVASICDVSPRRLFLPAHAECSAAGIDGQGDIVHRTLHTAPYRAALAEGDLHLLSEIHRHYSDIRMAPNVAAYEWMAKEFDLQFPNGVQHFDDYNFITIIQAITYDQQLRASGTPREHTHKMLEEFMEEQIHKITGAATGHHSPLHLIKKACSMVKMMWDVWNEAQRLFFYIRVIGYLQRLLSKPDAQALCGGYENIKETLFSNDRPLKIINTKTAESVEYFPLDVHPHFKLGIDFAISVYPHCAAVESQINLNSYDQQSDLVKRIFSEDQCHSQEQLALSIYHLDLALDKLIQHKIDFLKKLRQQCEPAVAQGRMLNNLILAINNRNSREAKKIYSISAELLFKQLDGQTPIQALLKQGNRILFDIVDSFTHDFDILRKLISVLHFNKETREGYFMQLIEYVITGQMIDKTLNFKASSIKKIVEIVQDNEISTNEIKKCFDSRTLTVLPSILRENPSDRRSSWEKRCDLALSRKL